MALPGSLESHRAVGGGLLANRAAPDPSGVAGMRRNHWLASVGITGWDGSESPAGLRRNTQDLTTGIAETLVRDRFQGRVRRTILDVEAALWGATEVSAGAPLMLIDLRVCSESLQQRASLRSRVMQEAAYRRASELGVSVS
jgi:hypothetical protein